MTPPRIARETLEYNAKWPRRSYSVDGSTDVVMDGDTYVVQAGPEFKLHRKNTIGDACMASPAIAGGSLILRTYTKLYRIGTKKAAG